MLTRYETSSARGEALGRLARGTAGKDRASLAWLESDCIAELQARFDIAAIGVACTLGYLDLRQPEWDWRGRYPRLAAWFAEVSQRPSMQATHA